MFKIGKKTMFFLATALGGVFAFKNYYLFSAQVVDPQRTVRLVNCLQNVKNFSKLLATLGSSTSLNSTVKSAIVSGMNQKGSTDAVGAFNSLAGYFGTISSNIMAREQLSPTSVSASFSMKDSALTEAVVKSNLKNFFNNGFYAMIVTYASQNFLNSDGSDLTNWLGGASAAADFQSKLNILLAYIGFENVNVLASALGVNAVKNSRGETVSTRDRMAATSVINRSTTTSSLAGKSATTTTRAATVKR